MLLTMILSDQTICCKSTGANSANKLYIIQNIDRKLSLNILPVKRNMDALIKEMEQIVYSGTKLNIKYWIDEMLDDDQQEEIQ
jgi:ATP-dependent DNA helicase RecQ